MRAPGPQTNEGELPQLHLFIVETLKLPIKANDEIAHLLLFSSVTTFFIALGCLFSISESQLFFIPPVLVNPFL